MVVRLRARPQRYLTYLKLKDRGENSMPGKADKCEDR
jgi:hypothetical protein